MAMAMRRNHAVLVMLLLTLIGFILRTVPHAHNGVPLQAEGAVVAIGGPSSSNGGGSSAGGSSNSRLEAAADKATATDADAKHQDPQRRRDDVPVFVMEEHQHALPIWINQLRAMNLPRITLLHIDAHMDLGVPPSSEFMHTLPQPTATRVNTPRANDEFIVHAMLHGLIDRMVWVIPEWSREDGEFLGEVG